MACAVAREQIVLHNYRNTIFSGDVSEHAGARVHKRGFYTSERASFLSVKQFCRRDILPWVIVLIAAAASPVSSKAKHRREEMLQQAKNKRRIEAYLMKVCGPVLAEQTYAAVCPQAKDAFQEPHEPAIPGVAVASFAS